MRHISTTPFGRRAVSAGLLAMQTLAKAPAPADVPDKWSLLRDLTDARAAFGISDRDLAVLAALLSFHPGKDLQDDARLMVFPSNATLSGRVHGMPESTLRRHLAALINAGLILRHDSPNGKRYAVRDRSGQIDRAYGFDLRPLLVRASEITEAAQTARQHAQELRRLRELITLRLRDASKLWLWSIEIGAEGTPTVADRLAYAQRALRRKLCAEDLHLLHNEAVDIFASITRSLPAATEELSGDDSQNERHYQNSDSDLKESESGKEKEKGQGVEQAPEMNLPLSVVLKAAPEIANYSGDPIRTWRDLLTLAAFVCPMLGISADTWQCARNAMGDDSAAVTVACILQRIDSIQRPGGYLRRLAAKAEQGDFSVGPMVMALLRAENHQAV